MTIFIQKKVFSEKGFTLIEVLVSLTMISIIVTGTMGLFIFSAKTHKNSQTSLDATYTARNTMEMVYELSRTVDFQSGIDIIKNNNGFDSISSSEVLLGKTANDQYVTIHLKESDNLINVIVSVYEDFRLNSLKAKIETLLLWKNRVSYNDE